mmetsp:Transcript_27008/g.33338  ORF Transcript_27008/g.33338 Transcript_27008/m.33338 type:complete len:707 (+) Transcript_27008:267-2387(+)
MTDLSTVQTLISTTEAIKTKSEIRSILDSIITDIEIKHEIETSISHEREIDVLKGRCELAERSLEEYKLIEKVKKKKNWSLVEHLVQDLGGVQALMMMREVQVENLKLKKQQQQQQQQQQGNSDDYHIETGEVDSNTNDDNAMNQLDVTAKFTASNANLNQVKEQTQQLPTGTDSTTSISKSNTVDEHSNMKKDSSRIEVEATKSNNNKSSNNENQTNSVTKDKDNNKAISSTTAAGTATATTMSATATTKTTQKTKRKKIKSRPPPTIQSLNNSILMHIFEYMDAIDIVNMAQTSVLMYSKVDSIFGLGGAGFDADGRDDYYDDDDGYEEVEEESDDDESEKEELTNEADNKQNQNETNIEIVNDVHENNESMSRPTSNESLLSSGSHATIVSIPPSSSSPSSASKTAKNMEPGELTPKAQNLTSTNSKSDSNSDSNTKNKNKSNNISTNTPAVTKASKTPTATTTTSGPTKTSSSSSSTPAAVTTATTTSSSGGYHMSSAVAASLASKLAPNELSAIITMREQLRAKEIEVDKMNHEFNDLSATLNGTLNVKDLLNKKIEELQLKLEQNTEISAKISRQTASDQEVISFLDERVQILEGQVSNFEKERQGFDAGVDRIKKSSEKQLSVLGDMLTFEREQMADHEKEWKATKKVLVKEVKHCRAQILALEAERDGFFEENMRLKEALVSAGSFVKGTKSFDSLAT